jgi:hypothetical protein
MRSRKIRSFNFNAMQAQSRRIASLARGVPYHRHGAGRASKCFESILKKTQRRSSSSWKGASPDLGLPNLAAFGKKKLQL